MVINVQLIAYALPLFIALGIIFIGIREWFQPSIAARDLVCHSWRQQIAIGMSHSADDGQPITRSGHIQIAQQNVVGIRTYKL